MKVLIRRATVWHDSLPPVEGAVYEEVVRHDMRFCKNPESLPGGAERWYSKGFNHRYTEGGNVCRDVLQKMWTLEADSIESIIKRYGTCIVSETNTDLIQVKIYDDYVE